MRGVNRCKNEKQMNKEKKMRRKENEKKEEPKKMERSCGRENGGIKRGH